MVHTHEMYNEIELSSDVMTASSHRLIFLLLEKCLHHIKTAKVRLEKRDVAGKGKAISSAMDILDYLRICLNFRDKEALEISSQLDAIYAYLESILLRANIENETSLLDEAYKLLSTIKSAWEEMPVNK